MKVILAALVLVFASCKKTTNNNYQCYNCHQGHHHKCDDKKCDSDKCRRSACKCSCNVIKNWQFN